VQLRAAFGEDVAFVHGASGIARRIAFLTQGQAFARARPDAALFTRDEPGLAALAPALAARGLERVEVL